MKTYQLTDQEFQVIAQGLGELPLKVAGPVFGRLMQQKQAQETPQGEPESHADKPF